jgi:outer membrane lipoprotein-sorting protein
MKSGLACCAIALMAVLSHPVRADARDEVVAAMEAMLARPSYRVTSTTSVKGPEPTVIATTIDVIAPSRFRVKHEANEIVIVPEGSWRKTVEGWTPMTEDMSDIVANLSPDAMRRSFAQMVNVREVGSEMAEGCEASHFVFDTEMGQQGQPMVISTHLWVCGRTGLPIRAKTGDASGAVTSTVVYDFDAAISIRAPG